MAHSAIYAPQPLDEGAVVSFPAREACFQMLYDVRADDGRIVLPRVVEQYWHADGGRGLAMLDSVARTLAERVDAALRREGWKVVGAEIPVVDTNRLFKNKTGRVQCMETRIDALFENRDGALVLGEFKSKIGRTTQTSILSTKEMRQAVLNAFLLWTNYGVMVKSVALIYVNRARSVFVCEFPFKPRMVKRRLTYESTRILRFLKAWERDLDALYVDENYLLQRRGEVPDTALSPFLRRYETADLALQPTLWTPAVAPKIMHTVPRLYKHADGVFLWAMPARHVLGGKTTWCTSSTRC